MKSKNNPREAGQAMVEYAIIVCLCVLVFGFTANLILTTMDDNAQGFYFILQQPYP